VEKIGLELQKPDGLKILQNKSDFSSNNETNVLKINYLIVLVGY